MSDTSLFTTSFTVAPPPNNCSSNTYTFISLINRSYRYVYVTSNSIKLNREKQQEQEEDEEEHNYY